MEQTEKKIYTLSELAQYYEVDIKTIYNWLKPIRQELLKMYAPELKKKNLSLMLPKQIKRIKDYLG